MFGRAAIGLGIGPHSSYYYYSPPAAVVAAADVDASVASFTSTSLAAVTGPPLLISVLTFTASKY